MTGRREFLIPVGIFALLALLPFVLSDFWTHQAILILIWAYLATCWNILGGYAGQHSLGHGLFMGVGAYGAAYLFNSLGVSPWLSFLITAAVAGALGWFIAYASFRYGLKGAYFALVTIALTEGAVYIVSNMDSMGGAAGLRLDFQGNRPWAMQFDGKNEYFYIVLVLALLSILLTQWLARRRFGYQLVAVRENEDAAEALGVNTLRAKIDATVVSAALTAIGGVFYVQYITYVGPRVVFGEAVSVQILLYAIIGGLGTVWGPAVGALILVPTAELARSQLGASFQGAHLLVYGGVLVLVMLFMPNGVVGLAKGLGRRIGGGGGQADLIPAPETATSQQTQALVEPGSMTSGGE
jgi:branched-chain amino acid transport system permease protein